MRFTPKSWRSFRRENGWEYGPWWYRYSVDQSLPQCEDQVALVQVRYYGRGWHVELAGSRRAIIIGYMHSSETHPEKWEVS